MNTHTAMTMCAFVLLMINTATAQDLESYRKKYDDGLTKITADHQQRIKDITKAYSTGLTTIKARVQAAGNLDKLKSVMAEISRFEMAKTLPTEEDKPIPEVLALVKDCQANIKKADIAKAQRIVSLTSQYDKALLRLQKEHTRKGEIDKATAIQEERKALAESETSASARALVVEANQGKQEQRLQTPKSVTQKPLPYPDDAQEYMGHHYKVFTKRLSWHEAKQECEKMGGHLVCITNEKENSFVSDLGNRTPLWLGGTDASREGKWEWVTGEPFTYSNWAGPNPSGDGDCLSFSWKINRGQGWNDVPASAEGSGAEGFVCEWDE